MPVIETASTYCLGQEFKRVIKCNKDGIFSIKLPPHVVELSRKEEVTGKTKQEVLNAYNALILELMESSTVTDKVIVYYMTEDIPFAKGLGLQVCADVMYRKTTQIPGSDDTVVFEFPEWKEQKDIELNGLSTDLSLSDLRIGFKVIPWTQEREDFFSRIGRGITRIIEELSKLKQEENLLEAIDNGSFLLATNKEQ